MPIPEAAAGKDYDKLDPVDRLALQIHDIANAALRGDITLDEWEIMTDQVTGQTKK